MAVSVASHPGTLRPLVHLVWPVLLEQLLEMLVGFSDTLLAGHFLAEKHVAAMANVSYLLWALTTVFALVWVGAAALVARHVGAGDLAVARRVTNQAVLIGAALALVLTAVTFMLRAPMVSALGLTGEPAARADEFLFFVLPTLPCVMMETVTIACLRAAGDMRAGLVTMAIVNVINIALSWSLLSGVGPWPPLGWRGIALGTASGHLIGGTIALELVLRGRAGLALRWRWLRPDRALIHRILRIGIPGGMDAVSIVTCQILYLSLINGLGPLATAAHGVAIRIESLAYLPGYAFHLAASTLAGQFLGARDLARARRSVLTACLLGGGIMSAAGLCLFLWPQSLVEAFVGPGKPELIAAAAPLLRIVAVVIPPFSLMMILGGALRGAGDTRWPLAFSLFGFLAVRLPATMFLAYHWGWGLPGAWYAMAADLVIRAALVVARFASGAWQQVRV